MNVSEDLRLGCRDSKRVQADNTMTDKTVGRIFHQAAPDVVLISEMANSTEHKPEIHIRVFNGLQPSVYKAIKNWEKCKYLLMIVTRILLDLDDTEFGDFIPS